MAGCVEVFNAATYEAALTLLAERARELGLRLTEIPAVPDGQPPFALHNDGVYRCPHCRTDQTDVIMVLMAIASLRAPINQGIFSREHQAKAGGESSQPHWSPKPGVAPPAGAGSSPMSATHSWETKWVTTVATIGTHRWTPMDRFTRRTA